MELYNATELLFFRTNFLQTYNSTTAIVPCCRCRTPLQSTGSSTNSITSELTCEVYYLAD